MGGWSNIRIDLFQVVSVKGSSMSIPIPQAKGRRLALSVPLSRDVKMYFSKEVFNAQNLNNARITQVFLFHIAMIPFGYDPQVDVGATLQLIVWTLLLVLSNLTFIPGRVAQYSRTQSESAIGLVEWPRTISFMLVVHDLVLSWCCAGILLAVQST